MSERKGFKILFMFQAQEVIRFLWKIQVGNSCLCNAQDYNNNKLCYEAYYLSRESEDILLSLFAAVSSHWLFSGFFSAPSSSSSDSQPPAARPGT